MPTPEEIYFDFASKISFFEFLERDLRPANIPIADFQREIAALSSRTNWTINVLSDYIKNNPKSFRLFEAIFQLLRFTNAQLIHFLFDVAKLNIPNLESIYEYMILNLKNDPELLETYKNLIKSKVDDEAFFNVLDTCEKKYSVAIFKMAISKYIKRASENIQLIETRISKAEFNDCSIRMANYFLTNLKINEIIGAINVERFLRNKQVPIDNKALHGNYAKAKIIKILEGNGYINLDGFYSQQNITTLKLDENLLASGSKFYCTEKYVEGIIKPKDNKLKKFDLIILSGGKPKHLFEINFYSTEGTKIGINQGEYIDLSNLIKKKFTRCNFYWITDGNYWLTSQGKVRFTHLLDSFGQILNITIFAEKVGDFA
ncbi:MAG: DpnII family type II restriction endonuclease [Candidatus Omnitrophota bacterium]